MLTHAFRRLESLQADLATIDPAREIDAADRVAVMAVALRDVLASVNFGGSVAESGDAACLAVTGG